MHAVWNILGGRPVVYKEQFLSRPFQYNNKENLPPCKTFYSDCSLDDLECMPIEKVVGTSVDERLDAETFWINELKTSVPHGLNSDAFTYV